MIVLLSLLEGFLATSTSVSTMPGLDGRIVDFSTNVIKRLTEFLCYVCRTVLI